MKAFTALRLLRQRYFGVPEQREAAAFLLAEKLTGFLYPKYLFSEFGRTWIEDREFLEYYERFHGRANWRSADRKFFLRSLLLLTAGLDGDTAECGAFEGASSYLICKQVEGTGREHHIFDSFEGLSSPGPTDGAYWKARDMRASEEQLRERLTGFSSLKVHRGWIPERFGEVQDRTFCFLHVDVDLHDPTRDSLEFFYPKMVPGGVILCDDYGFASCPGARKAMDDFMAGRPERIVHAPTGQGFIIKR